MTYTEKQRKLLNEYLKKSNPNVIARGCGMNHSTVGNFAKGKRIWSDNLDKIVNYMDENPQN